MGERKHPHYFKDVSRLEVMDVYRLLELYEVTCPVAQHVIKKALAAGKRGAKDAHRDMQDIADSASRWLEMRREDEAAELEEAKEPGFHITVLGKVSDLYKGGSGSGTY